MADVGSNKVGVFQGDKMEEQLGKGVKNSGQK